MNHSLFIRVVIQLVDYSDAYSSYSIIHSLIRSEIIESTFQLIINLVTELLSLSTIQTVSLSPDVLFSQSIIPSAS